VAQALMDRPGESLPLAVRTEAALEGAYRLLNNAAVTMPKILGPHHEATAARIAGFPRVYAVSDTSEMRFGGEDRDGLGPLQGGGRGFLAHVCVAVAGDGSRLPLGLLSVETIVRAEEPKAKRTKKEARSAPDRESLKWERGVRAAAGHVRDARNLIHVMDREADIYSLLACLEADSTRFIVRVAQDRSVVPSDGDGTKLLFAALGDATVRVTREVPLTRRVHSTKQHPARGARVASLSIATKRLVLKRPTTADASAPASVTLNFVHVFEPNPPDGEAAVDWKLVTNEPCDTIEEIEAVVDGYRTRWVIEELFKALKTGCGYLKSQLESFDALENLLAIQLPVAVQLLALRSLAFSNPAAPATFVLTPPQLAALRAMSRGKGPKIVTAEDALAAIARLGAHLKNNGPPGWQVLARGFAELLRYTEAWLVFGPTGTSDQS
jgi:hypothetical protein